MSDEHSSHHLHAAADLDVNNHSDELHSSGLAPICVEDIDGHSHSHSNLSSGSSSVVPLLEKNASSAANIHHLLHHIHNFHQIARRRAELLVYMALTLVYFGVACTLFGANFLSQDFIEANFYLAFHYAEFWSAFLFTLLEAFILVESGIFGVSSWMELAMLGVVGLNIVSSFVAALLFTFSPETFERPSHYVEYASQITVTLANFIFIARSPSRKKLKSTKYRVWLAVQIAFASVLFVASIIKVLVFTSVIETAIEPERAAHFFEFTGEMVNSLWAFFFALTLFKKLAESQKDHENLLKNE